MEIKLLQSGIFLGNGISLMQIILILGQNILLFPDIYPNIHIFKLNCDLNTFRKMLLIWNTDIIVYFRASVKNILIKY